MINKLKNNWPIILILVLVIASLLRLWNLGTNPPGLTPDEAALGYNAYSILKTGKDEFGKTLPVIFKSFGDYKPGLYVYFDVPFVATLGLSEVSTRLPSAVAGILIVYLVYLFSKLLFERKFGILAAFVAAINPWLIYFSRGAWEANVSLCLTLFGIYFFLKALKSDWWVVISGLFFSLTLITYQGAKLSTAIVLLILLIVYWKEFWKIKFRYLLISFFIGISISVPIILSFFNGQTFRLNIYSIFSYRRPIEAVQIMLSQNDEKIGSLSYFLFHSESLNYVNAILGRYFNNFSGRFLFFEGDWANPISTAPYQGVLLFCDLIFLPLGIFITFRNKISKGQLLFFLWLLLAPLSAALSRDDLNAVRDLNLAIPMIFFISYGLFSVLNWVSNQKIKFAYYILLSTFYTLSIIYFLDALFIHLPVHNSNYWRYGYKEAAQYILVNGSKYNNIVFEQSFNQPYIYFLFYQKHDPSRWQKESQLVSSQYVGDVGFEEKMDNIQFKKIDWSQLKNDRGALVISAPSSLTLDYQNNANLIKEIKFLNGHDVAFDIIQMK